MIPKKYRMAILTGSGASIGLPPLVDETIGSQTGSGTGIYTTPKDIAEIEAQIKEAEATVRIKPQTLHLIFHIHHLDNRKEAKSQIKEMVKSLNRDFSNGSLSKDHPNDPQGFLSRPCSGYSD